MIESNIRFLSRMALIYTCISKLAIYIANNYPNKITDDLKHYTDSSDYNRIFYHQRNDDMEQIIQTLLSDSDKLLELCGTDYEEVTEYQLFLRCLSDQTVVKNGKRRQEFSNYAKLRNGVETVPANIRKNYRLDKLPRGKQRGKLFFGSKLAALNFRKLFGFRKGLVNYAQSPIFG